MLEENISAKGQKEKERARLQEAHAHQGRAERTQAQKGQRAKQAERLAAPVPMRDKKQVPFDRITSSRQIREIRTGGKRGRGKNLTVWLLRNDSGDIRPSVCVVTSRGFGNAVERNLARRRLRGCIMELRDLLRPGYSYLVEARPGAARENYQLLVADLMEILSRAGIAGRETK